MFDCFSDLVNSIETVQVIDSEVNGENFSLSIRIDEVDLGWIAIESVTRFCMSCDFGFLPTLSGKNQRLGFLIQGHIANIAAALPELRELVSPQLECLENETVDAI